jgi:phenylalanine-4-hydroxylase
MSLSSNHPGLCDPIYRQRRISLAQYAQQYRWDQNQNIPIIDYTTTETNVWTMVYDQMVPLVQQYACQEYQQEFQQMHHCGLYTRSNIPQQSQIYPYLYQKTQFRLRPVAGLLQSRDFLNALALRVFCSTQYIRHASQPYYTPEPDLCHELLGHVPLLGNPIFADLSQQIGLASLGATDEEIVQLAKCYWHSVEFGLCYEESTNPTTTKMKKAYGAGLLSSFGELEYACGDGNDVHTGTTTTTTTTGRANIDHRLPQLRPRYVPWDPYHASQQEYPITTYQPLYYVADSIQDALEKLKIFCDTHIEPKKSYTVSYNPITERIDVAMK